MPTQPPPLLALCARHCRTAPPRAWPALVVATLARCPRVVLHHWARRQLKRPDKATPRPVSALQAGARAQTGSACTRRCRGTMLKFSSASRGSQQSWIWARPMGEDALLPFSPHCPLARSSPLCRSPHHSGLRLSLLLFSSSFFSSHPTTPSTYPSVSIFVSINLSTHLYLHLSDQHQTQPLPTSAERRSMTRFCLPTALSACATTTRSPSGRAHEGRLRFLSQEPPFPPTIGSFLAPQGARHHPGKFFGAAARIDFLLWAHGPHTHTVSSQAL